VVFQGLVVDIKDIDPNHDQNEAEQEIEVVFEYLALVPDHFGLVEFGEQVVDAAHVAGQLLVVDFSQNTVFDRQLLK